MSYVKLSLRQAAYQRVERRDYRTSPLSGRAADKTLAPARLPLTFSRETASFTGNGSCETTLALNRSLVDLIAALGFLFVRVASANRDHFRAGDRNEDSIVGSLAKAARLVRNLSSRSDLVVKDGSFRCIRVP